MGNKDFFADSVSVYAYPDKGSSSSRLEFRISVVGMSQEDLRALLEEEVSLASKNVRHPMVLAVKPKGDLIPTDLPNVDDVPEP
jgi:hypothetical protein